MDFVLASTHGLEGQPTHHLHVPPLFLAQLGCTTVEEYEAGVVHVLCDTEPETLHRRLCDCRYCAVGGTVVFRHTRTRRTALLPYTADVVLLTSAQCVTVRRVREVRWQEDDDAALFFSLLSVRVALGAVGMWRHLRRNDAEYLSVPVRAAPVPSEALRHLLLALGCEFGVNVHYAQTSARSLLVPLALVEPVPHVPAADRWAVVDCDYVPRVLEVCGVEGAVLDRLRGLLPGMGRRIAGEVETHGWVTLVRMRRVVVCVFAEEGGR